MRIMYIVNIGQGSPNGGLRAASGPRMNFYGLREFSEFLSDNLIRNLT